MTEIDPQEAAALAEAAGADDAQKRVAVVSLRDFTEPRTLSAERIAHLRKTLSSRLQSIANAIAGPLRGHQTVTLGEVAETNAYALFDGFVRPFLVAGFECAGTLGWLIWDSASARSACDTILSGAKATDEDASDEAGDPALSRTERRVVASVLDEVIGRVCKGFDLAASSSSVWQEVEELTTLQDLGPDADSRRLLVHLSFDDGAGNTSDMRLYLPGVVDPDDGKNAVSPSDAPSHLATVDLEISAHLGSTEVPLSELLAIEIGDVVPLNARIGDLVEIEIEEAVCARGRFGSHDGRMAVSIVSVEEQFHPDPPGSVPEDPQQGHAR